MKLISAIIRPHALNDTREALQELGITGLTTTEVHGYGRQKGHTELYRGAEYSVEFQSKVKIEIAVKDDFVDPILEAISQTCGTGKIGDGKIFVLDIDKAVRIRTGETGEQAL
ncbi:P-II family nitrogen regulator [Oceanospirillum maris]|uniref:P-II family nitrogen regulator n=1 Tax=Oceanospirillum maris TaxID=64977 RepID=UPI000421C792|nr:P-II family nitrogen regulator [Oceanospirillum maris]